MHGTNIKLFADLISERLEISCDALSGANIANEVARDRFSETTIGVRKKEDGDMWKKLFSEYTGVRPLLECSGSHQRISAVLSSQVTQGIWPCVTSRLSQSTGQYKRHW